MCCCFERYVVSSSISIHIFIIHIFIHGQWNAENYLNILDEIPKLCINIYIYKFMTKNLHCTRLLLLVKKKGKMAHSHL